MRTTAESPGKTPPRVPRRRSLPYWRSAGALLLVLACGGWLGSSESGLRFACFVLERLSVGQLVLERPSGRLADAFSLRSAQWRNAAFALRIDDLELRWQPAALLRGRLAVERLLAQQVRLAIAPSSEAAAAPDSLELPLTIELQEVAIGSIEVVDYASESLAASADDAAGEPVAGTRIAEAVRLRLLSEAGTHALHDVHGRVGGLTVSADASIVAVKPFPLYARAAIDGSAAGKPLAFDLAASGPLADFQVVGGARPPNDERSAVAAPRAGDFAGKLNARVTPFAPQPIAEAVLELSAVDPAAWFAGAPTAALDLRGEVQPTAGGHWLAGSVLLVNHRAGPFDRKLLPLSSLAARLRVGEDGVRLHEIDLRLPATARLRGEGELDAKSLALRLSASELDASVLHSRLRRTQLSGPLHATLAIDRQTVTVDLRDAGFSLAGKLATEHASVTIETLRLLAGNAQLMASGKLATGQRGEFSLQGTMKDFDPARFAKVPSGRVNAEFVAQGRQAPQLALALRLRLRDSHFGGRKLAGGGEIELAGERLRKADLALDLAGNRFVAKGAFGAAGDVLHVGVAADQLDLLGVSGDLNGELRLSGSTQAPAIAADLRSHRLALAGVGQLRELLAEGRLGAGTQGALTGKLRLAAADTAQGETLLDDLRLEASGTRDQHRATGEARLGGNRRLRAVVDGRLASGDSFPAWSGVLRELVVSAVAPGATQPFVRLLAPAPVRVSVAAFAVAAGDLAGNGWTARVDQLRYEGGRLRSAGSVRGLPLLATLAEFPSLAAPFVGSLRNAKEPLQISADWDLGGSSGDPPGDAASPAARRGGDRLRVWRESGDVVLGALPLALERGHAQVTVSGGRLEGSLELRSRRFGELGGSVYASSSGSAWIDRQRAWNGRFVLNSGDLAWIGPLLGEGWQVGGRLAGEVTLGGTPEKPLLAGDLRGDELALRMLDLGLDLERGELRATLAGETGNDYRLLLRQLVFDSRLQTPPRTLLLDAGLDASRLTARPGRLEASGELRSGHADGFLHLRAERLGLTQRADRWTMVSGEAKLGIAEGALDLGGRMQVDAAYWQLGRTGKPQVSDDVVVRRARTGAAPPEPAARLLKANLEIDLGRNFHFRGAGVESRLVGALSVRSDGTGPPRATGSIRTRDGRFDAYGQKLDIQRGILNFVGLLDNPGLNVRAVRSGLPVEAGVEVTGTVRKPIVRLVSDPEVPDAEKLSWLLLGHAPDQGGGQESAVLLAAAQTILGGQDGGPLKALQQSLGIDEFGVTSGTLDGSGRRQSSRIASSSGFSSADTVSGQIVSVGKRLSANVLLSYEQSLTTTGSIVKLTVDLSRNLSFVGRAGSENALDLFWSYRFGGATPPRAAGDRR